MSTILQEHQDKAHLKFVLVAREESFLVMKDFAQVVQNLARVGLFFTLCACTATKIQSDGLENRLRIVKYAHMLFPVPYRYHAKMARQRSNHSGSCQCSSQLTWLHKSSPHPLRRPNSTAGTIPLTQHLNSERGLRRSCISGLREIIRERERYVRRRDVAKDHSINEKPLHRIRDLHVSSPPFLPIAWPWLPSPSRPVVRPLAA